jgi:hypothetical protein
VAQVLNGLDYSIVESDGRAATFLSLARVSASDEDPGIFSSIFAMAYLASNAARGVRLGGGNYAAAVISPPTRLAPHRLQMIHLGDGLAAQFERHTARHVLVRRGADWARRFAASCPRSSPKPATSAAKCELDARRA